MGWKTPEQQRAYDRSPERVAKRRERDRQRYRTEKRNKWVKEYNKSEKRKEYGRKHREKEHVKKARHDYYKANQSKHYQQTKAWYHANLERAREIQKQFRDRHRFAMALHVSRNAARKKGHVPCLATAQEIEAKFTGKCHNPNCSNTDSTNARRLHMDHCHVSGRFRGWLCATCNHTLGFAKDDPTILKGLLSYLKKSVRLPPAKPKKKRKA